MKRLKAVFCFFALTLLAATVLPSARADDSNRKTVVTFSQAVEIPGKVLPAGTYTFQQLDSPADRHIVQISNADGTQIIATVLAINDYRLQPSGGTVSRFSGTPGDSPEALRAWFSPGDTFGQEFVYPKTRAIQLAQSTKQIIPAVAADTIDDNVLMTISIVAVTPDQKEVEVTTIIQSTSPDSSVATPEPVAVLAPAASTTASTVNPAPVAVETPAPSTKTELVAPEPSAAVAVVTPTPVAVETTTPVAVVDTPATVAIVTPAPVAVETATRVPAVEAPALVTVAQVRKADELPQTASPIPLIVLLGGLSITVALGLKLYLKFVS